LDSPAWGMQFVRRENAIEIGDQHFQLACAERLPIMPSMSCSASPSAPAAHSTSRNQRSRRAGGDPPQAQADHAERTVFGEGDGSHLAATRPASVGSAPSAAPRIYGHSPNMRCTHRMSRSTSPVGRVSLSRGISIERASQIYALPAPLCATVSKALIEMLIDNPTKASLLLERGGYAMIYGPDGRCFASLCLKPPKGCLRGRRARRHWCCQGGLRSRRAPRSVIRPQRRCILVQR
jgi:nitrilase